MCRTDELFLIPECSNSYRFFTSDTTFYFLDGVHHFVENNLVAIKNVKNLSMVGLGTIHPGFHESVMQSTVQITCLLGNNFLKGVFGFFNVTNVSVIPTSLSTTVSLTKSLLWGSSSQSVFQWKGFPSLMGADCYRLICLLLPFSTPVLLVVTGKVVVTRLKSYYDQWAWLCSQMVVDSVN